MCELDYPPIHGERQKQRCCYLHCEKDALFEIAECSRNDPDNFTYACEEHVGALLGTAEGFPECTAWHVSLLRASRVGEPVAEE